MLEVTPKKHTCFVSPLSEAALWLHRQRGPLHCNKMVGTTLRATIRLATIVELLARPALENMDGNLR